MAGNWSAGVQRATEALLSSHGGFTVLLRLPGVAVSGADGEQLGLSTPMFQEVPIGPAVWRRTGSETVLMVGAMPIAELAGSGDVGAAVSLLQNAVGVVSGEVKYLIESADPVIAGETPCAYLLTLQAPVWH